jgi:hypothetical protein
MHFLTLLGQDVEIIVSNESASKPVGALTVRLASAR